VAGSLSVTKRLVTASITAADKIYDGTTSATITGCSLDAASRTIGKLSGSQVGCSGTGGAFGTANANNGKQVTGTVGLTGSDAGNYQLSSSTVSTTANVDQRPITVTADAKTKVYGAGDPNLTYNITQGSLVNGDGLTGSLTRVAGESVAGGPYAIKQGTLTAGPNYNLSYVDGNLTITKAPLTLTADNQAMTLNGTVPALTYKFSGFKFSDTSAVVSGSATCSTADGKTVGSFDITCSGGSLIAANYYFPTFVKGILTVKYAAAGTCNGEAGHSILQPINADGTSVFKQGSTVPAKFRVCDANGVSVGSVGLVTSFKLVQTISGTESALVNEAVTSTTPDTAFRWDPTAQQWIFNINTKSLNANKTYVYQVTLNDGSTIGFQFGLK
jgi:hypothetical protein